MHSLSVAGPRRPLRIAAALGLVSLVALAAPTWAAPGSVTQELRGKIDRAQLERSYAQLVEAVLPAVVNVQVERTETTGPAVPAPFADPDLRRFFERFFGQPLPPVPERGPRFRARGEGSGFFVDGKGHIVTNAHVVAGADKVHVVLQDGTRLPAEIVGVDEKTDLAVLKVQPKGEPVWVEFGDSSKVRVGDKVIAVGNPFGLGGTVTAGIVSSTGRELGASPYDEFIQIDAPINRGNSGGPTFNLDGEVVGVNSIIVSPTGGNIGIGFAISSNTAKQVVAQLIEKGTVERGWLGVQIQPLDEDLAKSLGVPDTKGALVAKVEPGSPADKAGIEAGWVIREFNGVTIDRLRTLSRAVAAVPPGSKVSLTALVDGRERKVTVEVGRQASEQQVARAESAEPAKGQPRLGLSLAALTPELREQLGIEPGVQGVVVREVDPDGPAAEKGVQEGDVITAVAGKPVRSPREVADAVKKAHADGRKSVLVQLWRDGQQRFVAIPMAVS
jgi:serine protease Do